jgi:hypothetical protein
VWIPAVKSEVHPLRQGAAMVRALPAHTSSRSQGADSGSDYVSEVQHGYSIHQRKWFVNIYFHDGKFSLTFNIQFDSIYSNPPWRLSK